MLNRYLLIILVSLLAAGDTLAQVQAPDFETQIIPVLTKSGCNSGACHGAAIGRGGFKLSLLGYDPDADYESIINEFEGRRVHLAQPAQSLLLRKPSLQVEHEGGMKLSRLKEGYRLILDWLKAGAPREPRRRLVQLDVSPRKVVAQPGSEFTIRVMAKFDNGTREDVTAWTVVSPADETALEVSRDAKVRALRRGQHNLLVRFLDRVDAVAVLVPLQPEPVKSVRRVRNNFIDDHINHTLDELHLPQSPPCDDSTFIRRVYLDLIGTLPTPEEVQEFLADERPDRRMQLVEELFQRPEYSSFWSYKWGDLLRIEPKALQPQGVDTFHQWIRTQVQKNAPLDQMARGMLLSLGDGYQLGPVNFHRVPRNSGEEAEYVSRVFMGVRLQCANCHNHPLDRWTQDDYHGLAAIFADLQRGRQVSSKGHGDVIHPRTEKPALLRIPGERFLEVRKNARAELTNWLTAADNPYFSRNAVNRLWAELMGRGLVHPVDDHRATNPPTHPELLDALAKDFVDHGFDVRRTIRLIIGSAAYQRSSLSVPGNKDDDRFYSRYIVRPLPPIVLVDAVSAVTGLPEPLGQQGKIKSAIDLSDPTVPSRTLDLLGRCSREANCDESTQTGGGLALTLHTMHGEWLNAKTRNKDGRLHKMIDSGENIRAIVHDTYIRAFGRAPTADELAHWQRQFSGLAGRERTESLEDFLWSLLNSSEFRTNH